MLHRRTSIILVATRCWPLAAATLALSWCYWPTLVALQGTWAVDPRYSHGFLVPLFSIYLCWTLRGEISAVMSRPDPGGIILIGLGVVMRLVGAATNYEWVESASLLPSLAGLGVMAMGWGALRPISTPIGFLVFMIPLPYRVELTLGGPLQSLATHASAILLQMSGVPSLEEGNTIILVHSKIGVVEACNGLSMLTFFFAVSAGLNSCVPRPAIERALIIAGAIPIALIANVARITTTGLLVEWVGHGVAGLDFHDLAGYLMMPFALALLMVESSLIRRLFRDDGPSEGRSPARAPDASAVDEVSGPAPARGESRSGCRAAGPMDEGLSPGRTVARPLGR